MEIDGGLQRGAGGGDGAITAVRVATLPTELEHGLVQWSGARAAERTLEFLSASIRNPKSAPW